MAKSTALTLSKGRFGKFLVSKLNLRFGVFGRFFAVALPLSIVCFALAIMMYESRGYEKAKAAQERRLKFVAHNHARMVAEHAANQSTEQIALLAVGLISDPDVELIEVVDAQGNILNSASDDEASADSKTSTAPIVYADENGYHSVGEVTIRMNMSSYLTQLDSQVSAASVLFLGLLISVLLASSLAYWWAVGIPLKRLTHAIQSSRAGEKHVPVNYSGRDQLGIVIGEYNHMQHAAEENKMALIEHQHYLEQRTVDLQKELESHADTSKKLVYQASHDPLTSLPNRIAFSDLAKIFIQDAKKNKKIGALCFLDLDRFKLANDTYGHQAGDALLVSIVRKVESLLRPQDELARLGGDEFGLLMRDIEPEEAMDLCREIVDTINKHRYKWRRHHLHVGLSAGVAIIDHQSGDYEQLLKIADLGCYMAKNAGGGRLHFNADNSPEARLHSESLFWVQEVETAIEQNRLELWMQPIRPTESDEDCSWVELLVRCRSKTGKVYPAGEFLPIAEHFGIVQNIDRWVVDTLVEILSTLPDNMHEKVSVNLSGQSISDELFLAYLSERLETIKDHAHRICFEITETAFISNFRNAALLMENLRALGCTFALDDFGSGSSSFEYLKNLRFDYLKIDGNYIMNIASSPKNKEVVRAMKAIADTFSLETIAECIEDEDALRVVANLGIQNVQGYLFGKPEPLFTQRANASATSR